MLMKLWIIIEELAMFALFVFVFAFFALGFLLYWAVIIWPMLAKFCWRWCVVEYSKRTII